MSDILTGIGAIGFETESTEGVAETIVAADLVLAEDMTVKPAREMLPRKVVRDDASPPPPAAGGAQCPVSGSIEMKGSGTAGTESGQMSVICDVMGSAGITVTADAGYAVRCTLNKSLSGVETVTAKQFLDGKYVTASGCRGNVTFNFNAGEILKMQYDGMGALSAYGDTAVLAAPADTIKPPVFKGGDIVIAEHHALSQYDLDGDGELLMPAAGSNQGIAITITQGTTAQDVKGICLNLQKVGTPANETNGLTVAIQTDSAGEDAGDPSGTPVTNGTSTALATSAISDTKGNWYYFEFGSYGNRPNLAASTTYHIKILGDWDSDSSNCIRLDTDVVAAGDQITQEYDGSDWNAVGLENISFIMAVAPNVENFIDTIGINLNNATAMRKDPSATEGYRSAALTGRGDGVKISAEPLEKTDAQQDYWAALEDGTKMFFYAKAGSTAGNIIEQFMYECYLSNVDPWGDREGEATIPIELHLADSAQWEHIFK